MKKNVFFENQSHLTSAKIKIYKQYIEGYLPKLLITFKECIIVDLFCGSGKNGSNEGSPLVLLDRIKYILSSKQISGDKNIKIHILFNDQDKENIDCLESELKTNNYDKRIIGITVKNEKYENYIDSLIEKLTGLTIPKFIFLDPFTYSNVKMKDLERLMSLPNTEVLLFIPIFHSYRFASKEFEKNHKTRLFIEEFTNEGIHNYNDIFDFMNSVKLKLRKDLSLDYVRPVLLDGGGSKNSLFLLTKHQSGMLLMNKVIYKNSEDGYSLKVENLNQKPLFQIEESSKFFEDFRNNLIDLIKKGTLENSHIVDYSIKEGLYPKHAKSILADLYDKGGIKVFDMSGAAIKNKTKWNIAEKINSRTFFQWI